MRKPPTKPKIRSAVLFLTEQQRADLSVRAAYIGSVQHKDTPSFAGTPRPREGATHAGTAEESADCMLCPRKWARAQDDATKLLRAAIAAGQFEGSDPAELPRYVWARDRDDPTLVYEARRLSWPDHGYKAYPLTAIQVASLAVQL